MARNSFQKPDWSDWGHLPTPALRFVLISLVEHRTNDWIVDELQSRYKIRRSPFSMRYYRFHPKWKAELARVQREYEEAVKDEAFASRRFIFHCIKEVYDLAHENQDALTMTLAIGTASKLI